MKMFTKKNILQKIIITIVIVILFNFIAPNISRADFGGVLFTPIQALVLGLGDGIMWMASAMISGNASIDNVVTLSTDTSAWYEKAIKDLLFLLIGPVGLAVKNTINAVDMLGFWDVPESIMPDTVDLPLFWVTPEKIFANEVPFLDINIINPSSDDTAASVLQPTVSSWYIALRNLAIIGMLSVLAYIGIRILLSSTATDKAKYKQHLMDWIIAISLLFFMHYIMNFSITMVQELTKALKENINVPILELNLSKYDLTDKQKEILKAMGNDPLDTNKVYWATDFTGLARFRAQLDYDAEDQNNTAYVANTGKAQMGYTIIYGVLVIYTVMFLFQYLKRLIYIIFLTMIAPLVALTYPIDKMNDGSAQAFNTWLKEYIYNLLIQPFHLILYSMLVGSAIELATDHLIYTLAVLGFMLPAEKILRKFFGFEKGSTGASIMSGAVGGAMVMNAINNISSRAKGGIKKAVSGDSKGSAESDNRNTKFARTADDGLDSSNLLDTENNNQNIREQISEDETSENGSYENYLNDLNNPENHIGNESQEAPSLENPNYMHMHPEEYDDDGNWLGNQEANAEDRSNPIRYPDEQANFSNAKPGESNAAYWDRFDKEHKINAYEEKPSQPAITGPSKKKGRFKAAAPIIGRGLVGLGKGVAKAYGAAALGTIGVAAGLASENYSNVLKYGAAGAVAGTALTGEGINKARSIPSNVYRKATDLKDEYIRNKYEGDPKGYKEYLNAQADTAFRRDKKVQQLYRDKFGDDKVRYEGQLVEKYKVAMKKAESYRRYGITDNDVIIKAMKAKARGLSNNVESMDDKQRIAAAKYADRVQISSEKDIKTMSDRLKDRGIKKEQINTQEELLRNMSKLD